MAAIVKTGFTRSARPQHHCRLSTDAVTKWSSHQPGSLTTTGELSPPMSTSAHVAGGLRSRMLHNAAKRPTPVFSADQLQKLKQLLAESEALHHKIMAKMDDPRFDVLEVNGNAAVG